ncbi:MAG: hypothetical protein H6993_17490 [Pseudomonadales bacterium]|nr:hypothetical protein [Pseudomonadales bacterium]MCP5185761.1 hypothetical protein [Pseudomonadales bacterium]
MTITSLLDHPDLWRADRLYRAAAYRGTSIPSGFPILDRYLPGGGWPTGAVSELCLAQPGIGELQLLGSALAQITKNAGRWVLWLNPPFLPYAPGLTAAGIDAGRMLLVRTDNNTRADRGAPRQRQTHGRRSRQQESADDPHARALWAAERAARSGTCAMVLAWLDDTRLGQREVQRLQVAARQGNTLFCLFRPLTALRQASFASLRLRLAAGEQTDGRQRLAVDIVKRHGGWPVQGLHLELDQQRATRADVLAQLAFWREERARWLPNPGAAWPLPANTGSSPRITH